MSELAARVRSVLIDTLCPLAPDDAGQVDAVLAADKAARQIAVELGQRRRAGESLAGVVR